MLRGATARSPCSVVSRTTFTATSPMIGSRSGLRSFSVSECILILVMHADETVICRVIIVHMLLVPLVPLPSTLCQTRYFFYLTL